MIKNKENKIKSFEQSEKPEKSSGIFMTSMNITNTIVGSGIIGKNYDF